MSLIIALTSFVGPAYIIYLEYFFSENRSYAEGFASMGAVAGVLIISAMLSAYLNQSLNDLETDIKSCLSEMIYSKSQKITIGADTGNLVNILQVDAPRIYEGIPRLGTLVQCPIQLTLAVYLMIHYTGIAGVIGLAVLTVCLGINFFIGKFGHKFYDRQMEAKDQRMSFCTELIGHIKLLKLYSWEELVLGKVNQAREQELKQVRNMNIMSILSVFFLWASPILTAGTIFLYYELVMEKELSTEVAFVTLSTLGLVQEPIRTLPYIIARILRVLVSSKRIEDYFEMEELPPKQYIQSDQSIELQNCSFAYGEKEILHNISFSISPGELVMIVGQVGSGKSSLLNGILGEIKKTSGQISVNGSLAFTSGMESWIINATVKDNILFGHPFDPQKYKQTIEACALVPDFASLPAGDLTEIGSKGINLSGGQKARVGLARAVYAERDIYLLDDPLSSVDAHVANHLVKNCLFGVLKGKTKVLVTHNVSFLHLADKVVVIEQGRISQSGRPSELKLEQPENKEKGAEEEGKQGEARALIEAEDRAEGTVTWGVYYKYCLCCGGTCVIVMILGVMLFWMLFKTSSDVLVKQWGESDDPKFYIKLYLWFSLAQMICILIRTILVATFGLRGSRRAFNKIMNSLIRAPVNLFYDITPVGRILNRLSKDMENIDLEIPWLFGSLVTDSYILIGGIGICLIFIPVGIIALPLAAYVAYKVQTLYISGARDLTRMDSISKSPILDNFSETLSGIKIIRTFQKEGYFYDKNYKLVSDNLTISYSRLTSITWLLLYLAMASTIFTVCIISVLIAFKSSITAGVAGLCITNLIVLSEFINHLAFILSEIETSMVSYERIDSYIQIMPEAPIVLENDDQLVSWPSAGEIEFVNVHMKYRPNTPNVLQGLTFTVQPAEKIGIAGRTGSGKSSLTLTLFRIIELSSGSIKIDGLDISKIGLAKLRQSITLIPQDPFLFKGTVRENLDPANRFDDHEITRIASSINFNQSDLQKKVDEGGSNFSVGERQLLCISRAALNKTRILICDEATAAVDQETDALIQRFFKEEFRECTILTIAHRLSTIMESDRVLVMSSGRVLEFDVPSELMKDTESEFYKLAKSMH